MALSGVALMWIAGAIAAGVAGTGVGVGVTLTNDAVDKKYREAENQIYKKLGSQTFEDYINDAAALGFIDPFIYSDAIKSYNKIRRGESLDNSDKKALTDLYNTLYANDQTFRENWNNTYSNFTNEEKLKWLDSAMSSGMTTTIPSPAYLDTSFDTYQKEVAPVKLYSNKELAELYDIDFNIDNILADYKAAGEAKVKYADYVSDVAKNMGERDYNKTQVDYLTAIRNTKSEAINKGMTAGAKAASEIAATREAIQNKALSEMQLAQTRTESTAAALLENARANLNATSMYTNLAKGLGNVGMTLYDNDVQRYNADTLANANFFSSDANLRAARQAANMQMAGQYNLAKAQYNNSYGGQNDLKWLFENIYLPANNGDVDRAVREIIDSTWMQDTGYASPITKQANLLNN